MFQDVKVPTIALSFVLRAEAIIAVIFLQNLAWFGIQIFPWLYQREREHHICSVMAHNSEIKCDCCAIYSL